MLDSAGGLVHDPARQIGSSRQIGRAAMPNTHAERERLSMPGVVLDEIKTPVRR
jgi:hypothetical protein